MSAPRATARLQFHRAFTLDDAVPIVPYLAALGISHLYASPLLTARTGSAHGYDTIDANAIDPERGGERALHRLVATLRHHAMGLILDIVPNHMGVGGSENAWWADVLKWGRTSPFASFFDVDWHSTTTGLRGKVLLPFLGRPYGECMAAGELALVIDTKSGELSVSYFDAHFPICPRDYAYVLRARGVAATTAALALEGLPTNSLAASPLASDVLHELSPSQTSSILHAFASGTPEGQDRLHHLLERQHYRLAWWGTAADEINWRRFFDVNELAGMCVERAHVFDALHRHIFRLYSEGLIDGVRVDHVDGLADPGSYARKLRRHLEALAPRRPVGAPPGPAILWVEKILAPGESLPGSWQTDGTTGYDFMDQVGALLHDPTGAAELADLWAERTGRSPVFSNEAHAARRQILTDSLASELNAAASALHHLAWQNPAWRDHSRPAISRTLLELLVHFPVYRIYARISGTSGSDRAIMMRAIEEARPHVRPDDRPILDLLGLWLTGAKLHIAGPLRRLQQRAMVRFHQLSAPTAAKSVEDTAFYRYGRLISRNDVGSDPAQFSCSQASFHAMAAARGRHFPRALLATATHDHKRGEDARARLAVLSEIPNDWSETLGRWMRLALPMKQIGDAGPAPDPADEIMLYQALIGAWPLDLRPESAVDLSHLAARLAGWQLKALREAKRQTGWTAPNEAYEAGCQTFLSRLLAPESAILPQIAAFIDRVAAAGALNSLSQTLLRLTVPGVPDLYQGAEFWDFSLVDPDNRQPVDFAARQAALRAADDPPALLATWRDGRIKQAVIARILAFRRETPDLFAAGSYKPLKVTGPEAGHVLAFTRINQSGAILAAVTLHAARMPGTRTIPLAEPAAWGATHLALPPALARTALHNLLDPSARLPPRRHIPIAELFATLPVAVLAP